MQCDTLVNSMSAQHKGHGGAGKKRSKAYYIKCAKQKKFKRNVLDVEMKGFLVTCNSHEDQAVRECYNLLNEYADKLYGPEQLSGEKSSAAGGNDELGNSDADESEEDDIETALQKEVRALKETKPTERRFQRLDCSAKNCLFIKANVEDPSKLGHEILSDIATTQILKSRFALRLLPVQVTCKAFVEDIMQAAEALLEPHFRLPFGESLTFSVLFKSRNNNSLSRDKVVPRIGQLIKDMNPLNSCDYHTPDRVVLVEVLCKICCLSVVRDFYKLRKYNLHEVACVKSAESPAQEQTSVAKKDTKKPDLNTVDSGASDIPNPESETEQKPSEGNFVPSQQKTLGVSLTETVGCGTEVSSIPSEGSKMMQNEDGNNCTEDA
ncbi:THUMP domain-containing protein 1-like [Liolophura sinensis]|uniref:THUMP domain-containing protein 1-like n=1 Tax=Liolophura sinensis TaxID=3198878 RepID=UPI0031597218